MFIQRAFRYYAGLVFGFIDHQCVLVYMLKCLNCVNVIRTWAAFVFYCKGKLGVAMNLHLSSKQLRYCTASVFELKYHTAYCNVSVVDIHDYTVIMLHLYMPSNNFKVCIILQAIQVLYCTYVCLQSSAFLLYISYILITIQVFYFT